ncbi:Fe-S cluster assembly protein SufD [Hydrococcus rivularis NIES-593]|uniref:Fe-S cluster assembly protein SufD n=1 Tax=Hydrococcus rivularis NIES-593 TaxID=1921803 RepID=A0A1U7HT22_9CYAN|nr:Fe-S cluster assembly protein SufD [Hydrococcus rivularis]OKH26674.1 Fe-S cluster assembly protein SufD [Hydrococcus rivularis NIES-593]
MSTTAILKTEETGLTSDAYLRDLLKKCEAKKMVENIAIADKIEELRRQAVSQVLESRIPSKRDEEWRFTDLSDWLQISFQVAEKATIAAGDIEGLTLPEAKQSRIVFVNGFYCPELSDVSGLPEGVYVGNLVDLPDAQNNKIVKYLARQEDATEIFTALNTSGLIDVAVIWANPNVIVETPIQVLFLSVSGSSPSFSQPRLLVVAETGSSLELVEFYGAVGKNTPYFTNAVTEIWVQDNAQVRHNRIQQESEKGFHIAKSAIAQARDSRYTCNEINLGGKLYRNNLDIFQTGEQTTTHLNGLVAISGEQVSDTHSAIFLTKPHGTTDQLHKCIIDGSAHAVFNGKVFVPKAAQLTNAAQLNRNLLLSPKARVNTKPELQITADNVKCSHGATVSQLEADEVFYLRSRGLTEADSRRLLVDAFAAEILERISIESLRQQLTQLIAQKVKN